jgi:hypothetical protein
MAVDSVVAGLAQATVGSAAGLRYVIGDFAKVFQMIVQVRVDVVLTVTLGAGVVSI